MEYIFEDEKGREGQIKMKNRKCFKTTEINEGSGICKACFDYEGCISFARKKRVNLCPKCKKITLRPKKCPKCRCKNVNWIFEWRL